MLDDGSGVLDVHDGEGVGTAGLAEQERIALRVVAYTLSAREHLDHATIGVLGVTCRDTFGDDTRARVASDMDHLGAGVGFLVVVGDSHRIEFSLTVVAFEHAGGIFPGDGRTCLDLCPRDFREVASAEGALGDEVIDTAFAELIARIPVLDRGVLDLGTFVDVDLDDSSVKLVLVAHRCGASFEIGDVSLLVGDDEGAFELTRSAGIDAEVGSQFHRAAHSLGDIHKRAIGEDG